MSLWKLPTSPYPQHWITDVCHPATPMGAEDLNTCSFSCCVVGTLPNEPSPHFQEEDILVNNTHGYELGSIRIKHRKKIVESHCWEERLREISRNEPWFAFLFRYFHRGRKHFKNVACLYSLY